MGFSHHELLCRQPLHGVMIVTDPFAAQFADELSSLRKPVGKNSAAQPAMSLEDIDPPSPPREAIAGCKTGKAAADHNATVFVSQQRSHDSRMSRALRDGRSRFRGRHEFVPPSRHFQRTASEATVFRPLDRAILVLFGKRNKMRFLRRDHGTPCMKANRRWHEKAQGACGSAFGRRRTKASIRLGHPNHYSIAARRPSCIRSSARRIDRPVTYL